MKNNKIIYTLHEYGAPSRFCGLEVLAKAHGYNVKHREIKQNSAIKGLIKRCDLKVFVNLMFILSLPFRKRTKIVLAVAPYNGLVPILMKLMRKHEVYYFTSFTCWDQSRSSHSLNGNNALLDKWRYFTNTFIKHIFAVSNKTKDEIIANGFAMSENISVVNHALRGDIIPGNQSKTLSFIQVGQLSYAKGVDKTLNFFKSHPSYQITFVGSGQLQSEIEKAAAKYNNIHYAGFIRVFDDLINLYKKHSFLLQNSQHVEGSAWEELFGLAIIEGMASGCIPVATDHTGPKEIITNKLDGIIYKAEDMVQSLEDVVNMSPEQYSKMRDNSIMNAKQYRSSAIACKWNMILM